MVCSCAKSEQRRRCDQRWGQNSWRKINLQDILTRTLGRCPIQWLKKSYNIFTLKMTWSLITSRRMWWVPIMLLLLHLNWSLVLPRKNTEQRIKKKEARTHTQTKRITFRANEYRHIPFFQRATTFTDIRHTQVTLEQGKEEENVRRNEDVDKKRKKKGQKGRWQEWRRGCYDNSGARKCSCAVETEHKGIDTLLKDLLIM